MGPLWHGTQASGADKGKHEGSNRTQALYVKVYNTHRMAMFVILGMFFIKNVSGFFTIQYSIFSTAVFSAGLAHRRQTRFNQVLY